ncbi:MAG: hypothetical protein P1U89_16865 [Verrucomicrobiales bacterium]|nr:hypothetical protein [Verrucomicrobiales bacterium]
MKNQLNNFTATEIVTAVVNHSHPSIRQALLNDPKFIDEYNLHSNATVVLGAQKVRVSRNRLFNAVRELYSGSEKATLTVDGELCTVHNVGKEGNTQFLLERGEMKIELPSFQALSPDSETRLKFLEDIVQWVGFPFELNNKWKGTLKERPLSDSELDEFNHDHQHTPIAWARAIAKDVELGGGQVAVLVPAERRYFERLVGSYDQSSSIGEYAENVCSSKFSELVTWSNLEGFLESLMLCSHGLVSESIPVARIGKDDLLSAYEWLDEQGDIVSQVGALEIGFRILPDNPEILPSLVSMVKQIRDDDPDSGESGLKLISALIILVDGLIAKNRILCGAPPFYRRLASISQASLIYRELRPRGVVVEEFLNLSHKISGRIFLYQNLADLRLEPRWNPFGVEPNQLKVEFLDRIISACTKYVKHLKDTDIHDLVLGDSEDSLTHLTSVFTSWRPGPLEGQEENAKEVPTELLENLETQLGAGELDGSSFFVLLSSAYFFRLEHKNIELAVDALKRCKYHLNRIKSDGELLFILRGLAFVSAVSRSKSLASEVRVLVRKYRKDPNHNVPISEAIQICLFSAANLKDEQDWSEFVGDWLTELAFSELTIDEANIFVGELRSLLRLIPSLTYSCGRAEAALISFVGRKP